MTDTKLHAHVVNTYWRSKSNTPFNLGTKIPKKIDIMSRGEIKVNKIDKLRQLKHIGNFLTMFDGTLEAHLH